MSTSPSRRALLRGLFAAGLSWLGLRAAALAAPAVPPNTDASSSRLEYCSFTFDVVVGRTTTCVYDGSSRLISIEAPFQVTTYSYDCGGGAPRRETS